MSLTLPETSTDALAEAQALIRDRVDELRLLLARVPEAKPRYGSRVAFCVTSNDSKPWNVDDKWYETFGEASVAVFDAIATGQTDARRQAILANLGNLPLEELEKIAGIQEVAA